MRERSIAIFCYQLLCSAKVWFYFSPTWATLLTDTVLLSLQKSLGTGMGGQSVEDLERVIAAMRRVVERLQGENDQLKKTVGSGGPQYGEVIKENKRLKVIYGDARSKGWRISLLLMLRLQCHIFSLFVRSVKKAYFHTDTKVSFNEHVCHLN